MGDQNAPSILSSEHALCRGDILFKGGLRFLNDADVVAILDENVVNPFPAGTICPGAVNENNIANCEREALRSALRACRRSTAILQCRGTERFLVPPSRYIF
jgi:hypothetical protein